jgi:hypothetical protein
LFALAPGSLSLAPPHKQSREPSRPIPWPLVSIDRFPSLPQAADNRFRSGTPIAGRLVRSKTVPYRLRSRDLSTPPLFPGVFGAPFLIPRLQTLPGRILAPIGKDRRSGDRNRKEGNRFWSE